MALASAQAAAGPARGRLALPLHMGHSQAQQRGVQALCGGLGAGVEGRLRGAHG